MLNFIATSLFEKFNKSSALKVLFNLNVCSHVCLQKEMKVHSGFKTISQVHVCHVKDTTGLYIYVCLHVHGNNLPIS